MYVSFKSKLNVDLHIIYLIWYKNDYLAYNYPDYKSNAWAMDIFYIIILQTNVHLKRIQIYFS